MSDFHETLRLVDGYWTALQVDNPVPHTHSVRSEIRYQLLVSCSLSSALTIALSILSFFRIFRIDVHYSHGVLISILTTTCHQICILFTISADLVSTFKASVDDICCEVVAGNPRS